MKTAILTLLRETDGYVSGQQICDQFGVSRTAVWKVMNQLKDEGYEIESISKKGYRMLTQTDVLSQNELNSRMTTKWAGREVYYFDEVTSTNTVVKKMIMEGSSHGTLVVGDMQTAGKGRRGRSWVSPAGTNIFMSIGLVPDFSPEKASMLTIVMALAVHLAVSEVTGLDSGIKWPNDIVVNGKKVCGILTEMDAEMDYIHSVIIGVGINVNQKQFPEEISATATSLMLEKGESVIRAKLIERVMYYFENYYETFLETLDLSGLAEAYNNALVNKDKSVRVLDPKGEYDGIAKGIDESGELIVETEKGTKKVYAGEVSVRGIYGYV